VVPQTPITGTVQSPGPLVCFIKKKIANQYIYLHLYIIFMMLETKQKYY
jgi:hypothetical protein